MKYDIVAETVDNQRVVASDIRILGVDFGNTEDNTTFCNINIETRKVVVENLDVQGV